MERETLLGYLSFDFEGNPNWKEYISQVDSSVYD